MGISRNEKLKLWASKSFYQKNEEDSVFTILINLTKKKKAIFRMVSEILRKQSDPNLGLFLVRYKNVQKFWREKLFFQKSTFQLIEH